MSITYPDHIAVNGSLATAPTPVAESAPYTPVYARSGKARNGRKAVKTWMILVPIGAVVLIGGAVAMAIGGEASEPLGALVAVEAPVVAVPIVAEPLTDTAPAALVPAAPSATVTEATPVVRPVAVSRSRTSMVPPRAAVTPVVAPAEPAPMPAGPQPYLSVAEPAVGVAPSPPTPTPVLPSETLTGPPID
ncbi:hypothetical protein [Brevundimonas sp.]|uniref:hypothetical protein n=1 Tax=Brevundimonas sp. TaxID=1871086 RepID=UPI0024895079|nr:hypothetical protein [Brevundimonas sp.]MDI1282657.1 hypothetical protein [Brevundimonas sp.]